MNLKRNFTSQKKFHYQVDGEKNPLHYNANGGQFLAGLDIKKSKKCKLEKIDISRIFLNCGMSMKIPGKMRVSS